MQSKEQLLQSLGNDNNIEVVIDRENGEIKIQKVLDIVEKVGFFERNICSRCKRFIQKIKT